MIIDVTLGAISLKCNLVSKPPTRKNVIVKVPGRDADIIQDLGASSRIITLTGIINSATKDTDKSTLEGYEGTTKSYDDGDDVGITVYVDSVNIPTSGGLPNHYTFTIRLIEYLQS